MILLAACGSDAGERTTTSKWDLWSSAVELRGINIWLGRADDPIYQGALGPGAYGPTFSQADFDALAATGCNVVNISHPGLYSVSRPYVLDTKAQETLDDLLAKIERADMFAIITMRTGPGRSEWTFHWGNDTTTDPVNGWFPASSYNEDVWKEQSAQDAWAKMWRHIAERYKASKVVVAYDLMCEPNSDHTQYGGIGPDEFYPAHANKLSDWNRLYPEIIAAIRQVDTTTPIVVGGLGYSGVEWLPFLSRAADPRVIYGVHQYEPGEYTHQVPGANISYPGRIAGQQVDKAALETMLQPIAAAKGTRDAAVVCNELGAARWSPNVDRFIDDQLSLLEALGVNTAVWAWEIAGGVQDGQQDGFNFRLGPDPTNLADMPSNPLFGVLKRYWKKNRYRPSNLVFE